ncbi:DndE family protein [Pseudomonas sp. Gutcm_11s]|uniref:DndE family protein n=1 Tax=Pseudomonas sp. Gutcm_11s TaxID=3026088 RepID=UPI00236163BC|nr:DndE family protein [Pseudomonas sp. Gutcm_11s]MDD0841176.1 DndE family protein [Pseudomonas sp. Gutcm_11s]
MNSFPHKFKISSASSAKLKYLKSKTGLTPNILCRFAISTALKDINGLGNASVSDLDGQEFNAPTLFGEHMDIYEALLKQFVFECNLEWDPVRCVASLIEVGLHKMGHVKSLKEVVQLAI